MSAFLGRMSPIRLYMPDAEAVSLVVEGQDDPQPLKKDSKGIWRPRFLGSLKAHHGRAYHFEVRRDGQLFEIRARRDDQGSGDVA